MRTSSAPCPTTRQVRRIPAGVAIALVVLSACTNAKPAARTAAPKPGPTGSPSASTPVMLPTPPATYDPSSDPLVAMVKRVAPAVVNVTTRVVSRDALFGAQTGKAVGTGFIIRSDGIIVTNFHVVESAVNIKVTLPPPDGRHYQARVIGGNSDHDLAILKVDAGELPTLTMGDSSKVVLGERVVALGYALALPGGPTVTSGIISSLARTVQAEDPNANNGRGTTRTYQDVLQTDAAINPGNSGGPLVDLAGNVIGINTAGSGSAENVGFSIAIDAAKPDINHAIANPAGAAAYLGVSTTPVDKGLAAQFNLPVDHGAYVLEVSPGGPASETAIVAGDIIVGFDGKPVNGPDDLGGLILAHSPGDRVTVDLVGQDGHHFTVTATLGVRPLPTNP
jgi:serine protease Do